MIRITSICVMSAVLSGALAWSTGAGAGTLNLHTSTPTVKVTPPKMQVNPQPLPPKSIGSGSGDNLLGRSSVFKGGSRGVTGGGTSPVSIGGEKIAKSPYNKSPTATFVTEDDSQNGPDHVDAPRSTGLSPVFKGGNSGTSGNKIGLAKKRRTAR